MPVDLVIDGDVAYTTQRETASFFDGEPVTSDMVTKIQFTDAKISEIAMFVDSAPIEAVYGHAPT